MKFRGNPSTRKFIERDIAVKQLEEFLDSERVVNLFGEKEDVYVGTAAGRYNHSDKPLGYLLRQQWSYKDDILLIIYIEGFDRIEKEFETIEGLINFMDLFVTTELIDIKLKKLLESL
jgi:hypothetical protein